MPRPGLSPASGESPIIHLRTTPGLIAAIDAAARESDTTRSAVMRRWLGLGALAAGHDVDLKLVRK